MGRASRLAASWRAAARWRVRQVRRLHLAVWCSLTPQAKAQYRRDRAWWQLQDLVARGVVNEARLKAALDHIRRTTP